MKKLYILIALYFFAVPVISAQGRGKGNGPGKGNKEIHHSNSRKDNASEGQRQFSKNQPAKVTAAFQRDYPYAKSVTWTKYKGDWTATFGSGFHRTTAVYHANGDRKDTRTLISRRDLPNGGIWDGIFRKNRINESSIMRIEPAQSNDLVYRLLTNVGSALFFNSRGESVNYDY